MPGLNLRGTPVATRQAREQVQKALDILQEIKDRTEAMGLPEYPKPKTEVTPLSDIDVGALSNRELETHMSAYTAYAMWILPRLAEAENAYKASSVNMKRISAQLKVSLYKDKTPQKEVDALVHTAPEFVEHELEHLKLYALKEVLTAHYKAYSKQAQALSRIIELRKLEFEQDQRQNSVSNYRSGPKGQGGLPGTLRRR